MSQIWLDRLEAATSKVERDEILLRDLKEIRSRKYDNSLGRARLEDEVEDQLRALADLAFGKNQ